MYDIITVSTATRDAFIKSPLFTNVHDPKHLKKLGFLDGLFLLTPLLVIAIRNIAFTNIAALYQKEAALDQTY